MFVGLTPSNCSYNYKPEWNCKYKPTERNLGGPTLYRINVHQHPVDCPEMMQFFATVLVTSPFPSLESWLDGLESFPTGLLLCYSPVIKHGWLENGPFITDFLYHSSIQFGDFLLQCLITRGYVILFHHISSSWIFEFTLQLENMSMSILTSANAAFRQAEFRPVLTEKTRPGQVCLEKKAPPGRRLGAMAMCRHQIGQEKLQKSWAYGVNPGQVVFSFSSKCFFTCLL